MTGDYMIQDQRVASRRPDVLVYEGPALAEDVTNLRSDRGSALRLDHGNRLGLDREADRRLSGRLPRQRIRTRGRASSAVISSSSGAT